MTHLRKLMLEELQRRNYAENTIRHYCSCLGARGVDGFGGSVVPTHVKVILSVGCERLNWSIGMILPVKSFPPSPTSGVQNTVMFSPSTVVLGGTSIRSENGSFGFVPLM